jgi:hypothetical protein
LPYVSCLKLRQGELGANQARIFTSLITRILLKRPSNEQSQKQLSSIRQNLGLGINGYPPSETSLAERVMVAKTHVGKFYVNCPLLAQQEDIFPHL